MPFAVVLSISAACFTFVMGAAVLLHDRNSVVHRLLAVGMFLFAVEELFRGRSSVATLPEHVANWQQWGIGIAVLSLAFWIGFSVSYARVNSRDFLSKWKWPLFAVAVLPILFVVSFRNSIFGDPTIALGQSGQWSIPLGWSGKVLQVLFLGVSVLVLFNLERTIRSSVGRMRWQIKFMALGIGGLFALRIYLASQSLLFSHIDTGLGTTNAVALLAANLLFGFSLYRARSLNMDVYLSTATIQTSFTVILVGIYLLAVGFLAQLTRYSVVYRSLPIDALLVFLCLTVLAVLLLSNRLRWKLRLFVSRHFHRPIYDYRRVWMELTRRTTSLVDANELSTAGSRMVSKSLEILSVSVWLVDESQRRLTLGGSTALSGIHGREIEKAGKSAPDFIRFLREQPGCVDLDTVTFSWPEEIMAVAKDFFCESRIRYAIGLQAGGEMVGLMTLNDDRVGGQKTLSIEDLALLETLASQLAAGLLNLKLSARLRQAQEIETFQTVSTFFVHDLKNVASRLSLTMQNLPANFDNPEFRKDALRVMSTSVNKIDEMCSRLAKLRQHVELKLEQCDLNILVASTLTDFKTNLRAELQQDLQPIPKTLIDSAQIQTVLTNLVTNANEAVVNGNGVIRVATFHDGNAVGFAVRDNGCGMHEEFIETSLFRPFKTTKKKGLGIGLFHSRLIVEAHRGTVEVNSTIGAGTEFRVLLPTLPVS
jgi:putative PEP-CTERM system histidine kinase